MTLMYSLTLSVLLRHFQAVANEGLIKQHICAEFLETASPVHIDAKGTSVGVSLGGRGMLGVSLGVLRKYHS